MPKKEKELVEVLKNKNLSAEQRDLIERDLEELRKKRDQEYKAIWGIVLAYKIKMEEFIRQIRLKRQTHPRSTVSTKNLMNMMWTKNK